MAVRHAGLAGRRPELRAFYPTDVLLQARDILFLWVARMVMMGLRFPGDIPFEHVYVHSVSRRRRPRMSKSLGTGIDPLVEIDEHGADAVRFGLLAMSSTQDGPLQRREDPPGPGAGQQAVQRRAADPDDRRGRGGGARAATVEDRWILSRLQAAKADAARADRRVRLRQARAGLYDFVYGELCDWYLELIKGREADEDLSATLLHVLRETLTLATR